MYLYSITSTWNNENQHGTIKSKLIDLLLNCLFIIKKLCIHSKSRLPITRQEDSTTSNLNDRTYKQIKMGLDNTALPIHKDNSHHLQKPSRSAIQSPTTRTEGVLTGCWEWCVWRWMSERRNSCHKCDKQASQYGTNTAKNIPNSLLYNIVLRLTRAVSLRYHLALNCKVHNTAKWVTQTLHDLIVMSFQK